MGVPPQESQMTAILSLSLSDTYTHMYLYYIHFYSNWAP